MRTLIFSILMMAVAVASLQSQDLNIHKTDGSIITVPLNTIDSITFVESGGTFVCGTSTVTDADGNIYNTVQIGDQCWMKENLKVGTMVNGSVGQTNNGIIEKYCVGNAPANCDVKGGLYQWDEMMGYTTTSGVQGICPDGWHLPTDAEWTVLTSYVSNQPEYLCNNNTDYIAKALAATTNWSNSSGTCAVGNNLSANNATNFTALPNGRRDTNGAFINMFYDGNWWSSSENDATYAQGLYLYYFYAQVDQGNKLKSYGFSVRCLKD